MKVTILGDTTEEIIPGTLVEAAWGNPPSSVVLVQVIRVIEKKDIPRPNFPSNDKPSN